MPTLPVSPNGVASPCALAAAVYSPAVRPGLGPGEAPLGVDVQALHGAEVEDDAAVARAVAGDAVRAAADRQLEAGVAREEHRPDDVRRAGGPDDQRGVPIDGSGS